MCGINGFNGLYMTSSRTFILSLPNALITEFVCNIACGAMQLMRCRYKY